VIYRILSNDIPLSMIPDNSNKEYAKNADIWKFIQICYWLW
jgi:hypothetical protein